MFLLNNCYTVTLTLMVKQFLFNIYFSCALPTAIQESNNTVYSSSIVGDRVTRRPTTIAAISNGHDHVGDNEFDDYIDDASAIPNGNNKIDEDEIKLYEGWNPIQYE